MQTSFEARGLQRLVMTYADSTGTSSVMSRHYNSYSVSTVRCAGPACDLLEAPRSTAMPKVDWRRYHLSILFVDRCEHAVSLSLLTCVGL